MKEAIVKTFCDFVRIDSPTGYELDFSNYLVSKLKKLGAHPYQDERGTILCSFKGVGKPILFAAHIDTVEPGRGIEPVVEGDFVKSSGDTILGADNKAAVASLFELVVWAKSQEQHRAFEVLFSIGEESGVPGVDTFDFSKLEAKEGLCFDISKPFGTIALSSPFYMSLKIIFEGKEADASTAERGLSVIPALGDFFSNVPQGVVNDSFINIGVVNGGVATNALLSSVELKGEIRSFSEDELYGYAEEISQLCKQIESEYGCKLAVEQVLENYGYVLSKEDEHVKNTSFIIENDLGVSVNYIEKYWGVSDANNINQKGIKIFNVGYGVEDPHTVRERVNISDLSMVFELIKTKITV